MKDPTAEVRRIPASDKLRSHLTSEIYRCKLDLVCRQELQKGRPVLILQKTQASFDQLLLRYQRDLQLLEDLPQPTADT